MDAWGPVPHTLTDTLKDKGPCPGDLLAKKRREGGEDPPEDRSVELPNPLVPLGHFTPGPQVVEPGCLFLMHVFYIPFLGPGPHWPQVPTSTGKPTCQLGSPLWPSPTTKVTPQSMNGGSRANKSA